MKSFRLIFQTGFMCVLLLLPAYVGATIIISPGLVDGSGDVENVLFNDPDNGTVAGAAYTVTGITNQTGLLVDFTSDVYLVTPSGGQARIEAETGTFDNIDFYLQDDSLGFGKVQFNIDAVSDGNVTLAFTDQFGTIFQDTLAVNGSGQNFFTAYSEDNQVIVLASIFSDVDLFAIDDLAQVRIGPTDRAPVPEPATMLLFGVGLAGIAGFRGKKLLKR